MVLGHQKILKYLGKNIEEKRLSHAYLFHGEEHLGKKTAALEFSRMIQCENLSGLKPCYNCRSCQDIDKGLHPDVISIGDGTSNSISIDQVRELRRILSMHPYFSKYRIIIIDNFEKSNEEASNAILKILEEPKPYTVLILVARDAGALPQTILSRVRKIRFSPVPDSEIFQYFSANSNFKSDKFNDLIVFSRGRPGIIFDFLEDSRKISALESELSNSISVLGGGSDSFWKFLQKIETPDDFKKLLENYFLIFHGIAAQKIGGSRDFAPSFLKEKTKILAERLSSQKIIQIIKFLLTLNGLISRGVNFNHKLAFEVLSLKTI